jgi:hypothetical protein
MTGESLRNPVPELAEGPHGPAFVILAYAGIHSCFVLLPSSPPTALGGSVFLTRIIQKQKTHGTQSMGLKTNINLNQMQCFCFRVFPCHSVANSSVFFCINKKNQPGGLGQAGLRFSTKISVLD